MSVSTDIHTLRMHALLVWRGLTDAQRSALRRSLTFDDKALLPRLRDRTHLSTVRALAAHGLVAIGVEAPTWLTPLGAEVLRAGRRADADASRRKFGRRKPSTERVHHDTR